MSDETQDEPVMDGAQDATDQERLSGLIEQVEADHGDEGPGAMADALRDRLPETRQGDQDAGAQEA
ncbi:hypothetical protein [Amnibacterium endophyticum]|uniref:Uncharacterized protein n=1 Tax=Amnibacterium endophyticum TaxID=2109337 RepID=A0ABW4LG74_9MICO